MSKRATSEWNTKPRTDNGIDNSGGGEHIEEYETQQLATGPNEIPVEAWMFLGGEGMDLLWDLMIKIEEQEHIPDGWRKSVLVPIYKEKGDVQECQNYRRIKLLPHTMKICERGGV